MSSRPKSKAKYDSEDHFAKIPVAILKSEAVCTLNHAAFKVLVLVASQYRGSKWGPNGAMALTEVFARNYGLTGRDTLYKSLAELVTRGLLVRTRDGIKSKRLFSLYGLGWLPIQHLDGVLLDHPETVARNAWRTWHQSDEQIQKQAQKLKLLREERKRLKEAKLAQKASNAPLPTVGSDANNFLTDGRESSIPMVGSDKAISVPNCHTQGPISRPKSGNTLRISEGGPVCGTGMPALLSAVPALKSPPNRLLNPARPKSKKLKHAQRARIA